MFQNMYTLNKTLSFELKPVGMTLKNFKKSSILASDKEKALYKREVQKLFDENFKEQMEKYLKKLVLDETKLLQVASADEKQEE